jgi:Dolichyl-phosphate-mannose-protein mannosyltransferase
MQTSAPKLSEDKNQIVNSTQDRTPEGIDGGVRIESILYPLAIIASIATWFFAIRYPLWLDETVSYWQIAGGVSQLWARNGGTFVVYPFVLCVAKSLLGTSLFALRLPSILAMLAATYLLYKTAKDLFGREGAAVATVIFCVYPSVVFASIDARPYAFATLAVTASIRLMLRWVRSGSTRDAILLGISSAFILYFHFMFGIVLPAFAIYLWMENRREPRKFQSNWAAAIGAFAVFCLPIARLMLKIFETRRAHVFLGPPSLGELALAFAGDHILALFAVTALLAAAMKRSMVRGEQRKGAASLALLMCFVPLLGFFLISVLTPIHMFLSRYYLAAAPGIALCWGMMISRIDSKWLRAGFCAAVAVASLAINYDPTFTAAHGYSWKYGLEAAEQNAEHDHAPILMCSDLPESDQLTTAVDPNSAYLAQLSYYKIDSQVLGLPRSVTPAARREIDKFLREATPRRQRFLAVAYQASYETIRYLMGATEKDYVVHRVGVFDHVGVVEFRPK